jgi:hypothetical protein
MEPKCAIGTRGTGTNAMRGILSAYLALYFPGGISSVTGEAPVRARSTKTTAKTTAKTV